MHSITSYGIALVKRVVLHDSNEYEFLFIKKRTSYAFITFAKGIYSRTHDSDIIKLFDNMTVEEKLCILSMNFSNIWYLSYLKTPAMMTTKELSKYENCKAKFDRKFMFDNGAKLNELIGKSKSIDQIWEMPKGMKNKNESDYTAALREFSEETGIPKYKYRVLWDQPKMTYTFVDEGVEYRYVYILAVMLDPKYTPRIDIGRDIALETSDIKFLNGKQLLAMTKNKKLYDFIMRIKKKVRCII